MEETVPLLNHMYLRVDMFVQRYGNAFINWNYNLFKFNRIFYINWYFSSFYSSKYSGNYNERWVFYEIFYTSYLDTTLFDKTVKHPIEVIDVVFSILYLQFTDTILYTVYIPLQLNIRFN